MVGDKYVTVRVPAPIYGAMKEAIEKEGYQNMSELIRTALREFLHERGYLGGDDE